MPQDRVIGPGFYEQVYAVVATVPQGAVTTYGDVAGCLGSRTVARQVGWALAALREPEVPWHRVINSQGKISFRSDTPRASLQMDLLRKEGHTFGADGRLDQFASVRHAYAEQA